MTNLTLWLAIPLLLAPLLARPEYAGRAARQLIMAGLGIAALHQGAGTLDPVDLRTIAAQSPHDAWFVGITAGFILAGSSIAAAGRNWRVWLLGAPLAACMLWISLSSIAGLAVGAAAGCIPIALSVLLARSRANASGDPAAPSHLSGWLFCIVLPIAGAGIHILAAHAFFDVTAHWQPLISSALVVVALTAATRRRWDGAATSLMLLAATRSGGMPFLVALLFGLMPAARRIDPGPRFLALAGAVSVALLVTVLLRDQVLLSVILAFGLAAVADGTAVVVAPVPARGHL